MVGVSRDHEFVAVDEFLRRAPGMHLTREKVWRLCRLKRMPHIRIGKRIFIDWTAFQEMAQNGWKEK